MCLFACDRKSPGLPDARGAAPPIGVHAEVADLDLGKLRQGAKARAEFKITNGFEFAVRSGKVGASCACITPNWNDRILAPKETASFPIEFPTGAHVGTLYHQVEITFHDVSAENKTYVVSMTTRADVVPDYTVDPPRIDFSAVAASGWLHRTVRLTRAAMDAPFAVTAAHTTHTALRVAMLPPRDAADVGNLTELDVAFDPGLFAGECLTAEIRVRTNSMHMADALIQIGARVERPWRLDRESTLLALMPDAPAAPEQTICVQLRDAANASKVAASCSVPGVYADLARSHGAAETVDVKIRACPSEISNSADGVLYIRLADQAAAQSVPLRVLDLRRKPNKENVP